MLTGMKHFAAHGSPQAGHNAAPFMGYGTRQVVQEMLVPFKAAVDLGGVKGVMMYKSCSVNQKLIHSNQVPGLIANLTTFHAP